MSREARRRGADRDKNLVGFSIADVHYAIDIRRVKEVIRPLPIVPLPHPPPAVLGVADHRAEVIPVLDVRRRFGLPPAEQDRRSRWIIVASAGRNVGLVVDAITDVFAADAEEQRSVPEMGMGEAARGIVAAFGHRGSLVFVLDVDRIAAAAEQVRLDPLRLETDTRGGRA